MSVQVQYPSDYVGVDGKVYPTIGEAFRSISQPFEGYFVFPSLYFISVDTTPEKANISVESSPSYSVGIDCKFNKETNSLTIYSKHSSQFLISIRANWNGVISFSVNKSCVNGFDKMEIKLDESATIYTFYLLAFTNYFGG